VDVPFLLSEAQMRRIEPFFPLSHGIPRVDDRRIVSGIVYVIKHGLMWRDAPKGYGPHKTIYNRFVRWSRLGLPRDKQDESAASIKMRSGWWGCDGRRA